MTEPVVEIPFAAGLNQSDQDELVDASTGFTVLQNVRQRKKGAVGKRPAFSSLGTDLLDGTARTAGRRLFTNGDQICVITGERVEVYVPGLECSVPRGALPEAAYAFFESPTVAPESIVADVAYANGYIAIATYANSTSGDWCLFVSIIDAETYAVVRGPEVVSSADVVGGYGLAVLGTNFIVGHCDNIADELNLFRLDTASAATITTGWTALLTITATDCSRQLAMASLSDRIVVAFDKTSGTSRVRIRTVNLSGLVESVDVNTASTSPEIGTLDISDGGDTLWVCWGEANHAHVLGLDPTNIDGTPTATNAFVMSSATEDFSQMSITTRGTGKALLIGLGGDAAYSIVGAMNIQISAGVAAPEGAGGGFYNAFVKGRPFLYSGRTYAWFSSMNGNELTLCEIVIGTGLALPGTSYLRPVCAPLVRGLVDTAGGFFQPRCRTARTGTHAFAFAFGSKKTGLTDGTLSLSLDFVDRNRWTAAEHFGSTYLSGGLTTVFDGTSVFESGFLCAPPAPSLDVASSGSQTFTNGGRNYVAVYAAVDADGNLHVSGVSNPSGKTGDITSKKVDVTIFPLEITMRGAVDSSDFGSPVQIFLYATLDGGEAPYHYVGSTQNPPGGYLAGVVIIEDALDEDSLAAGALLYGSGNLPGTVTEGQPGGPQDHRAPPGLSCLVSYNGMLCGISGREIWACSQPVYGEGIWWSPIFTAQCPEPLTALFVVDGTLYATGKRTVYALSGEPPNDAGTSGGLSAPRKLGIDRGCIAERSVCVTNIGTFYQSERGIELFRQGGIDPIGDYVQDTLATYPIVTSAVLDVPNGLVRIALAKSFEPSGAVSAPNGDDPGDGSGGGVDLIFDMILGVWISVDLKDGYAASQDAALLPLNGERVYGWLSATGEVWTEDASTFLDDGTEWVTMIAETGWIHIAGLNGEQFIDRVILLAKTLTSHDLTIEIAFDYSDTYATSKTFTSDQIDALVKEWLDREVNPTTSQAVRLRFTDVTPSSDGATVGTGEGGKWVALTVNGQPHKGAKRTSGAQRGG